jgi:MFS family permease
MNCSSTRQFDETCGNHDSLFCSGALLGFLAAACFYHSALMQLPSGLLSDSWEPYMTISVFFTLAGLVSLKFGLVVSMGFAILARVPVGLGVAIGFGPTMNVISN